MAFVVVVVAFVIMAFVFVACSSSFRRVRLKVVFEGVGRTQRFAFQVRRGEPIAMPRWRFCGRKPTVQACKNHPASLIWRRSRSNHREGLALIEEAARATGVYLISW